MLKYLNILNLREKNFMVNNPSSFSLPSRALINFHGNEWTEEIKKGLSKDIIEEDLRQYENIRKLLVEIPNNISDTEISDRFSKLFRTIWNSPSETKEDSCRIISLFNIEHYKIGYPENKTELVQRNNYMKKIILCFLSILKYKLKAHEIMNKSTSELGTGDNVLQSYISSELSLLLDEFVKSHDRNHLYMVIYMIYKYLNIDPDNVKYPSLYRIAFEIHGVYESEMSNVIDKMFKDDINAINIIDKVSDNDRDGFSIFTKNKAKRIMEENYLKNKVSDKTIRGELCIGDDIFGDTSIDVNTLMIEISKLNQEAIKDYIGGDKSISYGISENEVGYLKLKEKLPVCKLLNKKGEFYTLSRYEDKPILLFKVNNIKKIFGLSFPIGDEGKRQLVCFELPENTYYKLEI